MNRKYLGVALVVLYSAAIGGSISQLDPSQSFWVLTILFGAISLFASSIVLHFRNYQYPFESVFDRSRNKRGLKLTMLGFFLSLNGFLISAYTGTIWGGPIVVFGIALGAFGIIWFVYDSIRKNSF